MVGLVRFILWALVFWRRYRDLQGKDSRTAMYLWVFLVLHLVALLGFVLQTPAGLALLVAALALAHPWFLARRVFIPLRLWPAAWAFGWLARLAWPPDGSGALVAGSWALVRARRPSARGLEFMARRIRNSSLGPASILAAGLLAASRGDRAQARELLESLEHLDPSAARRAHRTARDFLLADAADRGEWRRAHLIASRPFPTSASGRFVGAVAARLAGAPFGPSDLRLRTLWLIAPRRRFTRELLRRALAAPTPGTKRWVEPIHREKPARAQGDGPLERALSLHVQLESRSATEIELDDLTDLGRAWDAALESGELRSVAGARGAELCARAPERVAETFSRRIEQDLAELVRRAGHGFDRLPSSSPTLRRAKAVVREKLLSELEMGFTALAARTEDHRELPAIDEWREYLSLRALHAELARVGGIDVRRVAFPSVHTTACNHAAWLWNDRDEYVLAESMFRWLLAEATIVGDARAIELQRKNVNA